jgi:hypothetical protein
VSYRDDHDAALARVAALEHELAAERAKSEASEAQVKAAQRSARVRIDRLERELAGRHDPPIDRPALAPPRIPRPIDPDAPRRQASAFVIFLALVVLGLGAYILAYARMVHPR